MYLRWSDRESQTSSNRGAESHGSQEKPKLWFFTCSHWLITLKWRQILLKPDSGSRSFCSFSYQRQVRFCRFVLANLWDGQVAEVVNSGIPVVWLKGVEFRVFFGNQVFPILVKERFLEKPLPVISHPGSESFFPESLQKVLTPSSVFSSLNPNEKA